MPELPEVETTVRYLREKLANRRITDVLVRQPSLRYRIRDDLPQLLHRQRIKNVVRRAKYILIGLDRGYLIIHLGMSGSIQLISAAKPVDKHSHCDIILGSGIMRYNDPRRFGCIIWEEELSANKLLRNLGVEPLDAEFDGAYLYQMTRGAKTCIKQFIMNPHKVVGVGNIYASEALWKAKISPLRAAQDCSEPECRNLAKYIKDTLQQAIEAGGTTLRDFKGADGKLGYFVHHLQLYGKEGEPCPRCGAKIQRAVIGQRSSFYCTHCQP